MKDEEVFKFVKDVFKNDKTIYGYHGSNAERKSGQKPESSKRWNTPAEMAQDFAREHFKGRYDELWEV